MAFVKLTNITKDHVESTMLINVRHLASFVPCPTDADKGSFVNILDGTTYHVKEIPSQIVRMLEHNGIRTE